MKCNYSLVGTKKGIFERVSKILIHMALKYRSLSMYASHHFNNLLAEMC